MTDKLKYVISEVNAILDCKYDLIKFDTLSEQKLLQILIDVLAVFEAGARFELDQTEPDQISVELVSMLSNVKYKPPQGVVPNDYRNKILTGNKEVVTEILFWLFSNKDNVKNTAYLAKYLKPPSIPNDARGDTSISDLLQQHKSLTEEFKEAHKRVRQNTQSDSAEMINDLKEMAVERDIVIKRLESIQGNIVNIPDKEHLLNISRNVRTQEEKSRELRAQHSDQSELLKKASDQLQRYINIFHGQCAVSKTPEDIIKQIKDEAHLNNYLVKEKLPHEIEAVERELSVLQEVSGANPDKNDLQALQQQISMVKGEVETLLQKKMDSINAQADKLNPFRQQANVIRKNKENTAEKLQQLTNALRDREATLADLQSQVQQVLGENVLRGDQLREYVAKLKNRGAIYKKYRSKLATYKVEAGILNRTLYLLTNADPTIEMALLNHKKLNIEEEMKPGEVVDPKTTSINELSRTVVQTSKQLADARKELHPMAEKLIPIRNEFQALQQEYETKKRAYDNASINISAQLEPLKHKMETLNDEIKKKENDWKELRRRIQKENEFEDIIDDEIMDSPRGPSKLSVMQRKMNDLERGVDELREKQRVLNEKRSTLEEQSLIWSNTLELLQCKLRCRMSSAVTSGKLTITHQSQMLTLQ